MSIIYRSAEPHSWASTNAPAFQDDSGHDPHPEPRRMLGSGTTVYKPSLQVTEVSAFAEIDPCSSLAQICSNSCHTWFGWFNLWGLCCGC